MLVFQKLDFYCERTSSEFWAEPLNALSNAAFIVAAVLLFLVLKKNKIKNHAIWFSVALIFLIGIGSFLFHTFADELTYYFDVVPIFVFQVFILSETLKTVFQYNIKTRLMQISIFVVTTLILSSKNYLHILNGSLGYIPSITFLVYLSQQSFKKNMMMQKYFLIATIVFAISLCFRSFDMPLCSFNPHGLHMLWHTLNSVVLYLLVNIIAQKLILSDSRN